MLRYKNKKYFFFYFVTELKIQEKLKRVGFKQIFQKIQFLKKIF